MAAIKQPNQQELAAAQSFSSASIITDQYLKVLANPDPVLQGKGGDLKTYTEVLRDDQVQSTFQQRRLAVVSAPWEVEAGAEDANSTAAADALRENLNAINWDEISDKMLYSLFYGYAVGEVMWTPRDGLMSFDIRVRDRARFRFGLGGKLFLQRPNYTFEEMPERKFWVLSSGASHSDNPYGVGLAHWLYWPVYFKRMDVKFWLIFLEKFGMPTAIGKVGAGQANDPKQRSKLLEALRSISTETAVVMPEGAEIELLEATRSGSASYDEMKTAMDSAIAKIVLSQTMTTDDGSSRSQSETHADVRDMIVLADADMLCESFNRTVVKWWAEYNFPTATPPRVWRNTQPPENLTERARRDKAISELGYEPTEEYIKENYGEGWVKKKTPELPPDANPFGGPPPAGGDEDFAESLMLTALKAGQRADQQAIVAAANRYASQYETILGARVRQLIEFAESSGDFDTFKKRLTEMFAEQPNPDTTEKLSRANLIARLMGALRAQR